MAEEAEVLRLATKQPGASFCGARPSLRYRQAAIYTFYVEGQVLRRRGR